MSESRVIPTLTTAISTVTDLEICSKYLGTVVDCGEGEFFTQLPNIRIANYYGNDGTINSVPFKEGELVVVGVNMPLQNNIWINNQGELIVTGADSNGYSIDENGYLIYDHCVQACLEEYYDCDYVADDYISM